MEYQKFNFYYVDKQLSFMLIPADEDTHFRYVWDKKKREWLGDAIELEPRKVVMLNSKDISNLARDPQMSRGIFKQLFADDDWIQWVFS